ncbi:MAG: DUF412 family protein [Succinivibrionaceae bacterium]|jgi:hypothetical protein|nr:DUF412 family protein [Succinivibrionaceae bacterium]
MILLTALKDGFLYRIRWPSEPRLRAVFPESTLIFFVRLGEKVVPAFLVFYAVFAFLAVDFQYVIGSIVCIIVLTAMLLSGYFVLGKRAAEKLPKGMAEWYLEVCASDMIRPAESPSFMDLAKALSRAFSDGKRDFLDDL